MADYAEDYTIDELFVASIARQIGNGERCILAVEVPLCLIGWLLAKNTHAPDSGAFTPLAGSYEPLPPQVPLSTADPRLFENSLCHLDLSPSGGFMRNGHFQIMFLSGVQIDKQGNVNNSWIGGIEQRKVRLPGGAGGAELVKLFDRTILFRTKHTRRVFVVRVDFITYPGWIDSVTWRRGGPEKVITNLAIMDFDKESRLMRLESLHRGVSLANVRENTGFDLIIPDKVPETEPPTREQVELLRRKIDPEGLRKSQFIRE